MTRPAGAVDLAPIKARLATVRAARQNRSTRSDQDIRMAVREFNHRRAVERARQVRP